MRGTGEMVREEWSGGVEGGEDWGAGGKEDGELRGLGWWGSGGGVLYVGGLRGGRMGGGGVRNGGGGERKGCWGWWDMRIIR